MIQKLNDKCGQSWSFMEGGGIELPKVMFCESDVMYGTAEYIAEDANVT